MKRMGHILSTGSLAAACLLMAAYPLLSQDSGAAGWLRVYGVKAENRAVLDGPSFMAGYLVGTAVVPAGDGNYLVAGYVKAYEGHPVELAVLKINPAGNIVWYREYGPAEGRTPEKPAVPSNQCGWASLAALDDGGALVAFGAVLLRIDRDGKPAWALEFLTSPRPSEGGRGRLILKNVSALGGSGFAVAGVYTPPAHSVRPASIFAARVGQDGMVVWSRGYPALRPSERPSFLVKPSGHWILGSEPETIAGVDPKTGEAAWARQVVDQPFQRGPKERPDIGTLQNYRTLGLAPNGDILFSGVYDLSWKTYTAPGILIARLMPDANGVRWTTRVHGHYHGGAGAVNAIKTAGDAIYLAGTSTDFGAFDPLMNNNIVAAKMNGGGGLEWIRSIGKKKRSLAKSEYCNEMANDLALTPDGGLILAGAANSFAHPDPGFHKVERWAHMPYDLALARFTPAGGIANLPLGRYPRIFNAEDPGDPKKVDVVHPPLAVRTVEPASDLLAIEMNPVSYKTWTGEIQTQVTTSRTGPGAQDGLTPVADFKLLPPPSEGNPRVLFDASASKGSAGASILGYEWTFGDGKTGTGVKPWHQYPSAGTWTVGLTAIDGKGREASVSKLIVVGNIVRGQGIPPAFAPKTKADYTIEILTGDVQDAGTDANVFVALYGAEDANGRRDASGDMGLSSEYETSKAADPFERGEKKTFLIKDQWRLDDVDHMILRHDNRGDKPGWYVRGVKITDSTTKKEWVFVPEQWLADDEGPDRRTWGKFSPVPPYPAGVLLKGEPSAHGLTAASDNIVILEDGLTEFYITACERGKTTRIFSSSGVLLGSRSTGGSGPIVFPYIRKDEWGVKCETSKVAKPESFRVRVGDDETLVWVFPKAWKGYEKEARRIALLYPLRTRAAVFDYPSKSKSFLQGQTDDFSLKQALLPILDYGAAALGIFGNIPDERLNWYLERNTEQYARYKALKVAAKILNMAENDLRPVVSQFFAIMDTLWKAKNWAERLPDVIGLSADAPNANALLEHLTGNDQTYNQIINVFAGLKTKFNALTAAVDANNPSAARSLVEDLRAIAVGPDPKSESDASHLIDYGDYGITRVGSGAGGDYPLSLLLILEFNAMKGWRDGGHLFLKDAWSKERSGMRLTIKNYEPPWSPAEATSMALTTFAPIIENIANIASIFIDTALCVDDKDPQWIN